MVESNLGLLPVAEPRPRLRLLRVELRGHRLGRRDGDAGLGGRNDSAVVPPSQREPGPHLVRPALDAQFARLHTEEQRGLAGRLRVTGPPGVVLHAPDQQGELAREGDQLAVLGEADALVLEPDDAGQPRLALDEQLVGGHVGVLAGEPVRRDPQGVERGLVDVALAQPGDDVDGVHAADLEDLGPAVASSALGEERAGCRAEGAGNLLLVLGRLGLAGLPALPLPQQVLLHHHLVRREPDHQRLHRVGLRPAAGTALFHHALSPRRPVVSSHSRSLPQSVFSESGSAVQVCGGDNHR